MRALNVLVLVLALVPEGAMAARWEKDTIPLWDFTPEEWRSYVQATVDDFNTNLPPNAPRLTYVPMGTLSCDRLPKRGKRGGITVCSKVNDDGSSFTSIARNGDGHITRALVNLNPDMLPFGPRTSCHELMHAVTDAPDDYMSPQLTTSCVLGWLDRLGPWDIAYAEQVYSHDSSPRHGTNGQHHRAKRGRA